jgi:exonuclease III
MVGPGNIIDESRHEIICLQETKREHFDLQFIQKFRPKKFTKFLFVPSVGASGGYNYYLEWESFQW